MPIMSRKNRYHSESHLGRVRYNCGVKIQETYCIPGFRGISECFLAGAGAALRRYPTPLGKILLTGLVLGMSPMLAAGETLSCEEIPARALEITAMRDSVPADGVQEAERTLERLRAQLWPCPAGEAMLKAAMGSNLHILGMNDEALEQFESGLGLLGEDSDPRYRAILHRGAGVVLNDLERHDQALEHYLDSMTASEQAGDIVERAKTSSNIGNLHNSMGNLEEAREFHLKGLEGFREAEYQVGEAGTLINLGTVAGRMAEVHERQGDRDSAGEQNRMLRDYNLQALEIFEELGNQRGIAYASTNVGTALDRLDRPQDAMPYHQRSLTLRKSIGDVFGEIDSRLTMASSLIRMGLFDAAEEMILMAEEALPDYHLGLAVAVASRRVELAEARGDFRDALDHQREITELQQAIAAEETRDRVEELRTRLGAEQREQEIELLRSEARVSELQVQRQQFMIRVGLVVAALLVILIAVLISRYRLRATASKELHRAARTDPLTGLSNRRDIQKEIEMAMESNQRTGQTFTVVMADIDNFKPVNDKHGHDAGDQVLIHLSRILKSRVRQQDRVARWGGEEFLLFLPGTSSEGAERLALELRETLMGSPTRVGDDTVNLSLTFGIAEYKPGMSMDTLVKLADDALYQGKRQGKDRVVVAASS